jgi:hypothetical protein
MLLQVNGEIEEPNQTDSIIRGKATINWMGGNLQNAIQI